ncbi:MAG: HAD family hydrolase, partial [Myxococcales bacterium]
SEAALALARCELHIPPELCWVADGRPRKPDPAGLEFLCRKLVGTPGEALFVGDTADDEEAARAARARGAPLVYAHVAAPGETTKVLERLLAETGA